MKDSKINLNRYRSVESITFIAEENAKLVWNSVEDIPGKKGTFYKLVGTLKNGSQKLAITQMAWTEADIKPLKEVVPCGGQAFEITARGSKAEGTDVAYWNVSPATAEGTFEGDELLD